MSANSSSNTSLNPPTVHCYDNGSFISTALCIVYILLLPLFLLVLYMGYQRWRKQRFVASAVLTSHSDVFAFHMSTLELITVLGSCFYCYGTYTSQSLIKTVGLSTYRLITPGQTLFHLLTCVERYLAVVHPVTYLGLRQAGGVRIRNISIGCVWLISLGFVGLAMLDNISNIPYYMFVVISFIFASYFSVCVLHVLTRPGPGEVGGNGNRIDQSKQRAFYTIVAIMGALLVRFFGVLVSGGLYISSAFSKCDSHLIAWSIVWFSLPSSLVLPLLFLHRAGKPPGCKRNTESV